LPKKWQINERALDLWHLFAFGEHKKRLRFRSCAWEPVWFRTLNLANASTSVSKSGKGDDSGTLLEVQDAAPQGHIHGGGAIVHLQLEKDVANVNLNGYLTDPKSPRDLLVATSQFNEFQNLDFTRG
jgi:hypothetical protein